MWLGLHLPSYVWSGDPARIGGELGAAAETAEAIGIRSLSLMDHFLQMEGWAPVDDPMLEGYTALGFLAGRTDTIRLGLLVTGVTYRNPAILAKTVASLDVLSGGRAQLGIGAAWYEREHRALGITFPPVRERMDRLEEAVEICLRMWGPDDGPFEGLFHSLTETLCRPAPLSDPRPPILIGGDGEQRTLLAVARYADACNLNGSAGPEQVRHKLEVLRGHCERVGRDPAEIEATVLVADDALVAGGTDAFLAEATAFADVGVDGLIVMPSGPEPVAAIERLGPVVDRLAAS